MYRRVDHTKCFTSFAILLAKEGVLQTGVYLKRVKSKFCVVDKIFYKFFFLKDLKGISLLRLSPTDLKLDLFVDCWIATSEVLLLQVAGGRVRKKNSLES